MDTVPGPFRVVSKCLRSVVFPPVLLLLALPISRTILAHRYGRIARDGQPGSAGRRDDGGWSERDGEDRGSTSYVFRDVRIGFKAWGGCDTAPETPCVSHRPACLTSGAVCQAVVEGAQRLPSGQAGTCNTAAWPVRMGGRFLAPRRTLKYFVSFWHFHSVTAVEGRYCQRIGSLTGGSSGNHGFARHWATGPAGRGILGAMSRTDGANFAIWRYLAVLLWCGRSPSNPFDWPRTSLKQRSCFMGHEYLVCDTSSSVGPNDTPSFGLDAQ